MPDWLAILKAYVDTLETIVGTEGGVALADKLTAARALLLDQITALRMAELDAANIPADVDAIQQGVDGLLTPYQATFTGNLSNAGTATIIALDALGGVMKRIEIKVRISGATAGAGITPGWYVTSYGAPVTFVQQTVPSLGTQHALAGTTVEDYAVGDLPEGLQGELRIASAGDDSALTFEATVSYEA